MLRTKLVLTGMVVLVMAAGVTVGRLSVAPSETTISRGVSAPDGDKHHQQPWTRALNLTPDQQASIDLTWKATRPQMDVVMSERKGLDKTRDQEIRALFTPEKLTAYDKILSDYKAQVAA